MTECDKVRKVIIDAPLAVVEPAPRSDMMNCWFATDLIFGLSTDPTAVRITF